MWKFFQTDKNSIPLCIENGLNECPTPITESLRTLEAHWKASAITTATTTTVVAANAGESILLTDIIIVLSKKVVGATIIVRFSDGTNTINMFTLDAATAGFQFSHSFAGGLRGWENASLQVVTDDATTVSVMVGYVHISAKSTKSYSLWNAER